MLVSSPQTAFVACPDESSKYFDFTSTQGHDDSQDLPDDIPFLVTEDNPHEFQFVESACESSFRMSESEIAIPEDVVEWHPSDLCTENAQSAHSVPCGVSSDSFEAVGAFTNENAEDTEVQPIEQIDLPSTPAATLNTREEAEAIPTPVVQSETPYDSSVIEETPSSSELLPETSSFSKKYDPEVNYMFRFWLLTVSNRVLSLQLVELRKSIDHYLSRLATVKNQTTTESFQNATAQIPPKKMFLAYQHGVSTGIPVDSTAYPDVTDFDTLRKETTKRCIGSSFPVNDVDKRETDRRGNTANCRTPNKKSTSQMRFAPITCPPRFGGVPKQPAYQNQRPQFLSLPPPLTSPYTEVFHPPHRDSKPAWSFPTDFANTYGNVIVKPPNSLNSTFSDSNDTTMQWDHLENSIMLSQPNKMDYSPHQWIRSVMESGKQSQTAQCGRRVGPSTFRKSKNALWRGCPTNGFTAAPPLNMATDFNLPSGVPPKRYSPSSQVFQELSPAPSQNSFRYDKRATPQNPNDLVNSNVLNPCSLSSEVQWSAGNNFSRQEESQRDVIQHGPIPVIQQSSSISIKGLPDGNKNALSFKPSALNDWNLLAEQPSLYAEDTPMEFLSLPHSNPWIQREPLDFLGANLGLQGQVDTQAQHLPFDYPYDLGETTGVWF